MKLANPLEANDWGISAFFKFIASLQLALWVVLGLNAVGVQIPILREALALICLLFVPGIILLRVLRLHQLNIIEGVLYTVGLSAATVMVTALFVNTAYVFVTPRPLSLLPFMVTMSAVVVALCLLSYHRDRDYARPTTIDLRVPTSPFVPGLLLLPFVSVLGAYLFN